MNMVQRHGAYLTAKRWGSQSSAEGCFICDWADLVAAITFGLIKRVIGTGKQCFQGVAVFSKGEAERGGDAVEHFISAADFDPQ